MEESGELFESVVLQMKVRVTHENVDRLFLSV